MAWQWGIVEESIHIMEARKQREKKETGEGDRPFQVMPIVTHIPQPGFDS